MSYETYFNYIGKVKDYHERKKIAFNKEIIIEQIATFIKNLYSWDSENAIENILELVLVDYKYSKQFLKGLQNLWKQRVRLNKILSRILRSF